MVEKEAVVHPDHYNQYNGFEVIDICEQLRAPDGTGNFNRGNAFKYLARAGWKNPDKQIEDLRKVIFYIQREIDRLESNNWMDADPDEDKTVAPTIEDLSDMALSASCESATTCGHRGCIAHPAPVGMAG